MIDYKKFEEKVKSMSAYDIIMAMVNGLRDPKTRIDMSTFGSIREGICYGCVAANAVLHIMDANKEEVKSHVHYRQKYEKYDNSPLRAFEYAINDLRCGLLGSYNASATRLGLARITPMPGQKLPKLRDDYTEEQLQQYEKLAKYQLTA